MLTPRQNFEEVLKGGNPDRFIKQYEYMGIVMGSAFGMHDAKPKKGEYNVVNSWGVTKSYPENTPGAFPVHTQDKIVVQDIENWSKYVKVPRVVYDAEEWEPIIEKAEAVDTTQKFRTSFFAPGVFEQCHYLCEIQNTMMYLYTNPDEMHELIDCITQFELDYAAELVKYVKPEIMFHHDDWGSQISTFMSPDMFREFYKPAYEKIYGYYKAHGVKYIVHHSDSYAATLCQDMIDMGIDVWQGVMKSNNIPELIKEYGPKGLTFMGGIDSGEVDRQDWTQENIRAKVREACDACGKLYFIPNASQGLPMSTYPGVYQAIDEEIEAYSKEVFK